MKIAVMVSGGGTNLQAIIDCIKDNKLSGVEIARVVSSRENTFAQQRAENFNIPVSVILRKNYISQKDYDMVLLNELKNDEVELIVLAGFL